MDSLDAKKGSVKGLCMSEAKKSKKVGEGARFLGVVINVLKCKPFSLFNLRCIQAELLNGHTDRPHLIHLLNATKLMTSEPTLFVPPSSTLAISNAIKSGSASSASKALKTAEPQGKNKWVKKVKEAPTPLNLAQVMVHDLLFAKRGLSLAKEHKVRKKLEKYKPAYAPFLLLQPVQGEC